MHPDLLAPRLVALAVSLVLAFPVDAAPDEIQVYTEELDDPGQLGMELHLNYVPKGRQAPGYPGEMASQHRLQVTPEFSYGLTRTLEAGLYLPLALGADGRLYGNGARLRLKFVAPREAGARFFWGVNGEYGYSERRISQSSMGLEIRPMIGYRDEQWLLSFNPILNTDLSGPGDKKVQFEPALKVTHRVTGGTHAGFEYYGEYGPIERLLPESQRTHYLYGVIDAEIKGIDLNFGIGRGLKNAEDQWIVKAILAIPFD
ncbi:MAG: hypothetical protein WAV95_17865 [Azonexus sp.]